MRTFSQFLLDSMRTGSLAAVATPVAIALCGKAQGMSAAAPINAVSHILFGDKAARRDRPSLKYTPTAVALNTGAMASWGLLFEALPRTWIDRRRLGHVLLGGAAVAAAAYVIDYYLVPKRLTPGFEKRLSPAGLSAIYVALAVSLGLGGLRRSGPEPPPPAAKRRRAARPRRG